MYYAFSTAYIRILTLHVFFQRLTSSVNSFIPLPWLSRGVEAVCVLIKAQDNAICSSWHGGGNVCVIYTKEDVAQYEISNIISLHSRLAANEYLLSWLSTFLPQSKNMHFALIGSSQSSQGASVRVNIMCAQASCPVTPGQEASSSERPGLVVVNRRQMDGLNYIYVSIFECPLCSLQV